MIMFYNILRIVWISYLSKLNMWGTMVDLKSNVFQIKIPTRHRLLFSKPDISTYISEYLVNECMSNDLLLNFDPKYGLVIEAWALTCNKYHESIKGLEIGQLLHKHGFNACLIDEILFV
ncbi:hypothetical protein J3Q64DRAFT_1694339 [Phycomyces blakesleeanus]|uniref:Uncharacterized protein n=2 Tax=Phycomyces blakesleeanus TaxID=4837 RepID=A0A167QJ31_PHYB8|nr:hypothetical protein PHYBLDRAFT_162838 [Phycomyces blakesleeanus NRRL 1555(-)]OAD79777.1 hypothetical protein PHYBLDRAFT_162838 [Phycomyces blakesleeanus NRRL 1555(-)]|eukprot:XP_018297817.1 hypothetical protein PHYBLDRAFT_162838 [Phycomyces blakesleeanus NRRL 1555(-)]